MNMFALAMIYVVLQAAPPVPRQTADKPNANGQPVQKNAATNQNPSASVLPPENAIEPQTQQGQAEKPHDSHEQITVVIQQPTSGWEKAYVVLTGLLAIIGMFGVAAAFRTLKAVEAQAAIMRGQLTAMQGQIAQMENSGAQTAELIRHAAGQATALAESAQAAKEMAEAARISAMCGENAAAAAAAHARAATANLAAFIHSQRPWLSLKTALDSPLTYDKDGAHITVKIQVENVGQMPAMGMFTLPAIYIDSVPGKLSPPAERTRMCDQIRKIRQIGQAIFPGEPAVYRFTVNAPASDVEAGCAAIFKNKAAEARMFAAKIIVVVGYGTALDKDALLYCRHI
jgi:hypothetical protein